jgi:glycosyltransferase involved in cell wall biosynthesis
MQHKVAIITRTRSRPRMLVRASKSVASQTLKDFVWIIVNDGGDPAPVDRIVDPARASGIGVQVIHNEQSRGMEAASNLGVRASKSDYIVIHDDDDSWQPDFLASAVQSLDEHSEWIGVSTHTMRVTERLDQDRIAVIRQEPHKPVLGAVHLADMLRSNLFPPISFLYRRSIFEKLEGYDESMKVFGDWDFNLRALLIGDIGIVARQLANYHVREQKDGMDQAYANSISPHLSDHILADAAYRNRWLRKDIEAGRSGLGTLLAMARLQKRNSMTGTIAGRLQNLLRGSFTSAQRSTIEKLNDP